MTQNEIRTIRNIIKRLQMADCGCSNSLVGEEVDKAIETLHEARIEAVSRIYIDTWLVGALECLLPESRDTATAVALSN
jgi:hypothetical protein